MVQLPEFARIAPGLAHGFSTRANGNMAFKYGDHSGTAQNREVFLAAVRPGLSAHRAVAMVTLTPGREDAVVQVGRSRAGAGMTPRSRGVRAEAMITEDEGLALFLPVADCIPIVLYDPRARVLALVHAGRQSSVLLVAQKTVETMEQIYHADPRRMVALLGPGIRSYELDYFLESGKPEWRPFVREDRGKIQVDLFGFNVRLLRDAGILARHIIEAKFDTAADERFFSHQRSRLTGEPEGRNAVVVAMV